MIQFNFPLIIYRTFLSVILALFCISVGKSQGLTIQLESSWSDYGDISNATVTYIGEVTPGAVTKTLSEDRKTLNYIGNGTYTLSNSPENILSSKFKIEIFEANHAPKIVQLSYVNQKNILLFHNNYYERCNESASQRNFDPLLLTGSSWTNCKGVDENQMIENFGVNEVIYFINSFTSISPLTSSTVSDHSGDNEIKQNEPQVEPYFVENQLSEYDDRFVAYSDVFDGIFKTFAVHHTNMLTISMQQEIENLEVVKNFNRDASNASEIAGILSANYPELELIFDGLGAKFDLGKAFSENRIDAILIFAAYLESGEDFYSRFDYLKNNSELSIDKSFLDALSSSKKRYLESRSKNLDIFVQSYIDGGEADVLSEIILGYTVNTAIKQLSILSYKAYMGAAAPLTFKIVLGVVASYVIWDWIESKGELQEKKRSLIAAAMIDEHLFGHIPNEINQTNMPSESVLKVDFILKLLNAYNFNETRAAINAGVYASMVEDKIKYRTPVVNTPKKAYEYKMVEVSNEKKVKISELLTTLIGRGTIIETREKKLNICDVWSVANSGGVEGTIDRWDISLLPEGVMLDIRYDTKSIPDKLLVEYPVNNEQLNTGWRGDRRYSGQNYPGGIKGPGVGQNFNMFRKVSDDTFVVKVNGVDDGTYWEYQVRCRAPESLITNETN